MPNNNASDEQTTVATSATHMVNNTTMLVSAETKVFVAGLGNNMTWKKLPAEDETNYTFINNLEEKVY